MLDTKLQKRELSIVLELRKAYSQLIIGPDERTNKMVAEALSRMPDDVREVFILKIFIELTFKEIAYVCDMSKKRAVSLYNRGLNEIGLLLEEKGRGSNEIE
jgi:DNA-directed RNA polymerase specialized sigma24 family protein